MCDVSRKVTILNCSPQPLISAEYLPFTGSMLTP